jgi:hypothetical protein
MPIIDLTQLINQAEKDLNQSTQLLEGFKQEWQHSAEHPLTDADNIRTMQLILQYRLDTQSTLYQLNTLQQYLLQLLGIEAKHSSDLNIERLAFALGSDELQHLLSMLNHLVDSLLKIIAHNQHQQILDRKKAMERLKNQKLIDVMIKVIDKQKDFANKMNELKLALEDIGGAPQPGIIYDHIAALEGPVSRFQQALQHGLILSSSLYQQQIQQPHSDSQMSDTLQSPDHRLRNFNFKPEQQRLFKSSVEHNKIEALEARASAKRLGNFFNH